MKKLKFKKEAVARAVYSMATSAADTLETWT
jgi:hypothetical protein